MVTFRDAAADAIRGALCAVIALNDDGARLFGRLPGLRTGADYFNFFAPLRADLCNTDPADVPVPDPPFAGGQCPVSYRAAFTAEAADAQCNVTSRSNPSIGVGFGPIRFLRTNEAGPGGSPANLCPGFEYSTIRVQNTNGSFVLVGGSGGLRNFQVALTREDGQPDDCGDPPVEVPPPGPVTRPINITYNNEDNDVVDIDGDITFSPYVSVGDLNIRIPFDLNIGPLNFTGNIDITPEFNLNISPVVNLGGGGTSDDDDDEPTGDPGTPPPPEKEPDEPVIIGVVVRSSKTGETRETEIATVGQPTILAPRIASVSFAIESSFTVAWTPDQPVKNRDCYVPCPAVQGAVGVSVSPEPGWECTFTAVRGLPANAI